MNIYGIYASNIETFDSEIAVLDAIQYYYWLNYWYPPHIYSWIELWYISSMSYIDVLIQDHNTGVKYITVCWTACFCWKQIILRRYQSFTLLALCEGNRAYCCRGQYASQGGRVNCHSYIMRLHKGVGSYWNAEDNIWNRVPFLAQQQIG